MPIYRFDNEELARATSPEGREGQLRAAVNLVGRGALHEAFVELPDGDVAHVTPKSGVPELERAELKRP